MRIDSIDKIPSNPKGVAMFLAIYGGEEITIQVRENLMVLIPATAPDTWSVEFNGEYLGEQGVDQVANGLVQFKRQVTAANRYRAFQSATNQPTWQSTPPQSTYPRLPLQPQSGYSLPRRTTTPEPDIIDIGSRLIGSVFGGIRRGLY